MDAGELMTAAIGAEGEGYARLLAGDGEGARAQWREAATRYRESWDAAGPTAYGRLIGLVKTSVLAGEGAQAARYARAELPGEPASAPAWYALALAALVEGDDPTAARAAEAMGAGGEAFARTGAAIAALARGEREAYATALEAIVADFAARPEHLTGVRVADTAVVLEALAAPRGLAGAVASPLLPRLA